MRLRLDNQTDWSTRDLRTFVIAGLRAEGVEGKPWRVKIRNARQNRGCSGWAYYDRSEMQLCIPSVRLLGKPESLPNHLRDDLAHVLWHEVAHTRGIRHGDMTGGWNGSCHGATRGKEVEWAQGLQVRRSAEPAKRNKVEARAEGAVILLAEWQKKLKLAQTKIRKYKAKVKYYEKRRAAAPPPETPQ